MVLTYQQRFRRLSKMYMRFCDENENRYETNEQRTMTTPGLENHFRTLFTHSVWLCHIPRRNVYYYRRCCLVYNAHINIIHIYINICIIAFDSFHPSFSCFFFTTNFSQRFQLRDKPLWHVSNNSKFIRKEYTNIAREERRNIFTFFGVFFSILILCRSRDRFHETLQIFFFV